MRPAAAAAALAAAAAVAAAFVWCYHLAASVETPHVLELLT